jgi:hypothetical protein
MPLSPFLQPLCLGDSRTGVGATGTTIGQIPGLEWRSAGADLGLQSTSTSNG